MTRIEWIQCDECDKWFRPNSIRMRLMDYRLYQWKTNEPFTCIQHVDRYSFCLCETAPVVGDKWVQCDDCDLWFHLRCLGLSYTPDVLHCLRHVTARENRVHYLQTPLGRDGYYVVKAAVNDVHELMQQAEKVLRKHKWVIFNDNEKSTKNDRKRAQAALQTGPRLPAAVTRLLQPNCIWTWHVLESKPGCQRQAAHTDYEINRFDACNPDVPHSVIVALQSDTYLDVWPGAHHMYRRDIWPTSSINVRRVILQPGDVLLFRADTVHAGSAYTNRNVRLHAFCGRELPPHNKVMRWNRCMPDNIIQL